MGVRAWGRGVLVFEGHGVSVPRAGSMIRRTNRENGYKANGLTPMDVGKTVNSMANVVCHNFRKEK